MEKYHKAVLAFHTTVTFDVSGRALKQETKILRKYLKILYDYCLQKQNSQRVITTGIYVLYKITIALKFISYISSTSSPAHLFSIRGRRKRGPGTLQTRDQNLPK